MALGALRRIRMPEEDIATIEFLIRHHLRMSTAAFRRDTADPNVVRQFARLVGTEQRLKLLCLLTLVDVSAVGPDVMTPWKEELLWRFYVDAYKPAHAGLRGRRHRHRRGQPRRAARQPAGGCAPERAGDVPRRAARALPAAGGRPRRCTSTCACRAIWRRPACTARWSRSTPPGSWRSCRATSPACSRRYAACCPTSAWTSCAARP